MGEREKIQPPVMTYSVVFSKKAKKDYDRLPAKDQIRVESVIELLEMDPFSGKKMQGDMAEYYTVRLWPYRILYTIERNIVTVTVVAIGHRKDVYRKAKHR